MARFDASMTRASKATETVFGDLAEWTQAGQPHQMARVIMIPATSEIGEVGPAMEQRIWLLVRKETLRARPTNGESVKVLNGLWSGTYTVDQVVDDTGESYRVAVE